jgi:hypothetical protein
MKKLVIIFLSIVLISSCEKDSIEDDSIAGNWEDNIKLSTKNVEFGVNADSVLITTEGNWWWVDEIHFNDSSYNYYNDENINLESTSYTIRADNFIVERRNKNTLFIKLDKNITGEERELIVGIAAGNYFDDVIVKQSAQ